MNQVEFGEFLFNIKDSNSVITGGYETGDYCPVRCRFCMCTGDAPSVGYKIPMITQEELHEGMRFIDPSQPIFLGDGISKLSAEAFAHPEIYEMLETLCKAFQSTQITIMTTGVLIDTAKIDLLNSLTNLHISMSINTVHEETRANLMPAPRTRKVLTLWKELQRVGFQLMHTGDMDVLRYDLETLNDIRDVDGFQLRRIEHSRYHLEDVIQLSRRSMYNYDEAIAYCKGNFPNSTFWASSLEQALKYSSMLSTTESKALTNIFQYRDMVLDHVQRAPGEFILCIAESSHKFWRDSVRRRKLKNVDVLEVPNITYGGSITTAGLLTFDDINHALDSVLYQGKTIIIPKIMLNSALQDLNGKFIYDEGLNKDCWFYAM